jgi:DNA-binding MarR family transcriptional regulator
MSGVFEEMAGLDRLVHEPSRLSILTALSTCQRADFVFLQRITGLTVGNLSSHIAKLEEAGLVAVEKRFVAQHPERIAQHPGRVSKRPNTMVELTAKGRETIERHWRQLEALHKSAQDWKPDSTP